MLDSSAQQLIDDKPPHWQSAPLTIVTTVQHHWQSPCLSTTLLMTATHASQSPRNKQHAAQLTRLHTANRETVQVYHGPESVSRPVIQWPDRPIRLLLLAICRMQWRPTQWHTQTASSVTAGI